MRETWVWSLGREGPLEKEMVTHSSILAWMEETGGTVHGVAKSRTWLRDVTNDVRNQNLDNSTIYKLGTQII